MTLKGTWFTQFPNPHHLTQSHSAFCIRKRRPKHEAPKSRKRSTQISKMEQPRLKYEAPKSLACKHTRCSSLFATGDVSRGGTSATQRQKFHTDDNLSGIRSEALIGRRSSYIVLVIVYEWQTKGKRPQRSNINKESLTKRSIFGGI